MASQYEIEKLQDSLLELKAYADSIESDIKPICHTHFEDMQRSIQEMQKVLTFLHKESIESQGWTIFDEDDISTHPEICQHIIHDNGEWEFDAIAVQDNDRMFAHGFMKTGDKWMPAKKWEELNKNVGSIR